MAATTLDSNMKQETQSKKTTLQTKNPQKKKNKAKSGAEFSRASRAKRKREVEYLKARNKQLVAEREEFLEKVAKLQSDAQYLRGNNEINLERENKILRAEVQEHKRFFRSLQQFLADQSVIQKDSDSLSDELSNEIKQEVELTKQQLLLQAATCSVEQVLGLCLTTSVNPSMQVAKLDDEKLNEKVKLYYQNLPVGSTAKTCKRVIIRTETNYDVPFEKGIKAMKKLIDNREMMEKKYEAFCKDTVLVAVEELGTLDSHPDLPKGTICKAVSHKIQENERCKTMVFITTEQVRSVPVRGMFREQSQKDTQVQNESPNAETYILATIQDETVDLAPLFDGAVPKDVVVASGAQVNGFLCSKNTDGTMHVVSLLNSPRNTLNMFGETNAESMIWIDDDGKPGPKLATAVKHTFDFELMIKLAAMDIKQ